MLAAYVRVSTASQDLAMQRAAIGRTCKARGVNVDAWYAEKTGGAGARPELDRLRADVREGKVRRIIVWRLDRLSRGGIIEVLTLVRELKECRCELESLSDGFRTDGPASDLVLACLASFAEMERAAIRARLEEARAALEADGGSWGRPRAVDRTTHARIHAMKKAGRTVRQIAIALKIPKSTVQTYLSEKTYPKRCTKS